MVFWEGNMHFREMGWDWRESELFQSAKPRLYGWNNNISQTTRVVKHQPSSPLPFLTHSKVSGNVEHRLNLDKLVMEICTAQSKVKCVTDYSDREIICIYHRYLPHIVSGLFAFNIQHLMYLNCMLTTIGVNKHRFPLVFSRFKCCCKGYDLRKETLMLSFSVKF